MRQQARVIFFAALILIVVGSFFPIETKAAKVRKQVHNTFSLVYGGKVSVENTNGNIIISTWDKKSVDVVAEIVVRYNHRRRAEEFLDEVEILYENDEDFVDIRVDYPGRRGGGLLSWLFGGGKPSVSVDFEIKVPQIADLEINTVNGKILIEDVQGDVHTRSTNGGIRLSSIKGPVSCKTVNGSITAEIEEIASFEKMSFRTTNGGIELIVPVNLKANVEVNTVNGGIFTDLPLEISGRFNRKSMRGKINHGGGELILKTVNGGVTIKTF
jgi:DUF4097 and DUF4098 domain-containing protein YvlB